MLHGIAVETGYAIAVLPEVIRIAELEETYYRIAGEV